VYAVSPMPSPSPLMLFGLAMLWFGLYTLMLSIRQIRAYFRRVTSRKID
jgi:hypothetical protein